MSKSFKALLKVSLAQSFDFRRKDKIKNASLLIPLALIFISGAFISTLYSLVFGLALVSADGKAYLDLILYAMAGIASMLAIVTGMTKVKGALFGGNDYDLLASMPISKKSIIFVKFFSLYLMQAFYTVIIVLPSTIVITILGQQPIWLLDGILLILFTPVLPLFFAGIIGLFIGLFSDRFKFGNIISILFYIIFLGAVMYSSFSLNRIGNQEEQNISGIIHSLTIFGWINPSTKLLGLDYVILPRLFYVVVNFIGLGFMIWIFAKGYDYFHFLMTSTRSSQVYVEKSTKQKGQFKALLYLDFKRYFSSKMYLMNTITGGVMCVLCIVVMIVSFQSIQNPETITILNEISCYFVLIVTWCVGMAVPSAVAINFEGKTMWQMKSLPIQFKQYSLSKILMSYLVLAPFVLVSSVVLTIYVKKTILTIFVTILLPQIYLFSMCCLGFLINTYFYKLKWTNETEAVKNSAGMLISMLVDLFYTGILCIAFIVPGFLGYYVIGAILSLVVVIAMSFLFYFLVSKTCEHNIGAIEV
ncbi:MAG: hypothetical protein K2N64_05855 [Anaeroplasmataceae bacterium]|nr:hypothetical protein [Anaeroplasmataceae bacterium]